MYVYDPEDEYSQKKIWLGKTGEHRFKVVPRLLNIFTNKSDNSVSSLVTYTEMMDEINEQLRLRNWPKNSANIARAGYFAALKLHGIAPNPPPKL